MSLFQRRGAGFGWSRRLQQSPHEGGPCSFGPTLEEVHLERGVAQKSDPNQPSVTLLSTETKCDVISEHNTTLFRALNQPLTAGYANEAAELQVIEVNEERRGSGPQDGHLARTFTPSLSASPPPSCLKSLSAQLCSHADIPAGGLSLLGSESLQTRAPCWGRPQDGQEETPQEAPQRSRTTHQAEANRQTSG